MGLGDWTPGQTILVDTTDGDSIFTLTVNLPAGDYEYKFLNGAAWGTDESAPNDCSDANNGNRNLNLSGFAGTDTILPVICFAKCDPCMNVSIPDTMEVTLLVNMRNEMIADTVSVAGSFQDEAGFPADWTPGDIIMTDTMGGGPDSIYELIMTIPEGTYQYKFINGADWGFDEPVPSACNSGGNREMVIENDGSFAQTVGPFCFGLCSEDCPVPQPPIMVTFRVDMNNEILSNDGVFVAGNMQDPNWVKNQDLMVEGAIPGVYEFTYEILRGEYEFKFFNGTDGDPTSDAFSEDADFFTEGCGNGGFGNNRSVDLTNASGDTILPAWEYNSCFVSVASSIDNELQAEAGFSVFPNPAKQLFTVEIENHLIDQVEVMDLSGKVVMRQADIRSNRYQVNRSNMPAGIYFLKVQTKELTFTEKVILE